MCRSVLSQKIDFNAIDYNDGCARCFVCGRRFNMYDEKDAESFYKFHEKIYACKECDCDYYVCKVNEIAIKILSELRRLEEKIVDVYEYHPDYLEYYHNYDVSDDEKNYCIVLPSNVKYRTSEILNNIKQRLRGKCKYVSENNSMIVVEKSISREDILRIVLENIGMSCEEYIREKKIREEKLKEIEKMYRELFDK